MSAMYLLSLLMSLRILFISLTFTVRDNLFPYLLQLAINMLLFLPNMTKFLYDKLSLNDQII